MSVLKLALQFPTTSTGPSRPVSLINVCALLPPAGSGDVSLWDFSGYEPYLMLYDHFIGKLGGATIPR